MGYDFMPRVWLVFNALSKKWTLLAMPHPLKDFRVAVIFQMLPRHSVLAQTHSLMYSDLVEV